MAAASPRRCEGGGEFAQALALAERGALGRDLGELCRGYAAMAAHCVVAMLPQSPRKLRGRANVEMTVLVAQRWIVAPLRSQRFSRSLSSMWRRAQERGRELVGH